MGCHIGSAMPVQGGRQRTVGGAGEVLKVHGKSSRARRCRFHPALPVGNAAATSLPNSLQVIEKLH
jgi:hypothetical protein